MMITKSKGLRLIVIACLALVLITLSQNSDRERHYVIAANLDISGEASQTSLELLSGIEYAIEQFNKSGGFDGTIIELEVYDNKSIPSEGIRNVTDAKESENIAMISYANHETMEAIASESNTQRVINIALWEDLLQVKTEDNYNFKIQVSSLFKSYLAANFAYNDFESAKKIVVISKEDDDLQDRQAKEFITRILSLMDIKTTHLVYSESDFTVSPIIEEMHKSDLVYIIGDESDVAKAAEKVSSVNSSVSILVSQINNQMMESDSFIKSHYYYLTTFNENNIAKDIKNNFKEDHDGIFNENIAIGFDAVSFLINSVMSQNSVDTEDLISGLSNSYNLSVLTGELSIDAYNNAYKSIWVNTFKNTDPSKYILVRAMVTEKKTTTE